MSTTSSTASTSSTDRKPVWAHGLAATVAAAAATTAIAAIAKSAGVSFEVDGQDIPLLGFTQLTVIFSLIGVGLAALFARRARRPRSTFVRTTVVLLVLSVIPDATFGFDVASALCLMLAHLVAASIVIPTLAARLAHAR